ncbi:hypothetical protein PPW95_25240 (plasmid) [Vibrio parahaemolyticus]|uniref:hypothetical protein n=1 Tax=Vibrio harveyi group TaxID=717610 RepID=UPI0009718F04|nr:MULTISPECIES: hypothetical protein [Vibrio harveyi group]APX10044.1 hypothetical protein BWP24_28050 [Vibrio campbellii]ARR10556.1 hypothetical protein Vc3S01_p40070 [Vibrio campbellii]WCP78916.1 hypothetical protein PPW95_25240 [Vibrio parahaemolyticus]WHP52996.1 hypothetical protein QMY43_25070 [Vibrio parahaemolyticus]
MRQINKANAETITVLHKKLTSIESEFNCLLNELDDEIKKIVVEFEAKHSTKLVELQEAYSATAIELNGVVSGQIESMKTYVEKRSETWLDGSSGYDYCYWLELWEEFTDFLERAEYQEFEFKFKLGRFDGEELPPFNPKLK